MMRPFSLIALAFGLSLIGFAPHAEAAIISYAAALSGANENPPNNSPGIGSTTVTIDDVAFTMRVQIVFSGLTSGTTASHIHAPATPPNNAGVATTTPTFAGFPLGVTSGTYDSGLLDLNAASTYNPSYVTANGGTVLGARTALLAALAAGQAYLNVHTTNFGSGEIRGFLAPVPEPASFVMASLGGLAVLAARKLRRG